MKTMIWSHLVFFKWTRRKEILAKLMERDGKRNELKIKREGGRGDAKGRCEKRDEL
jgi:hypothetical protein